MPRLSCARLPPRFAKYRNLELILVGDEGELQRLVSDIVGDDSRLHIAARKRSGRHVGAAGRRVAQEERLVNARRRSTSSRMATADACVSAGNTGALMATAKFVLKMLPGIDRPAIIAELPAMGGSVHMLDLGANTQATADQLFQYAVMGSIVAADIVGIDKPRIGAAQYRRRRHQGARDGQGSRGHARRQHA